MQIQDMIFGMPTLLELKSIEENCRLCSELGLQFIELNMNLPEFHTNKMDIVHLNQLRKAHKIFYTIHLPEDLDVLSLNEDIRTCAMKIFTKSVELAKQLEAPILNMHLQLGIYFTMPNEKIYLNDQYIDQYLENVVEFERQIQMHLEGTDILLCIENTGIYQHTFVQKAVARLLENKQVAVTWDVGHDHASGNQDYPFIEKYIEQLKHLHLHDAIGSANHLELFTGEIDLLNRLEIAQAHKCRCVIETKTIESLRASIQSLRSLGHSKNPITSPVDNKFVLDNIKQPSDWSQDLSKLIQFIGTGSAFNTKSGNNSAYFKHDETLLLIDCGGSVFHELKDKQVLAPIKSLHIFITHTHPDHIGSLGDLIFYAYYALKIMPKIYFPEKTLLETLFKCIGVESSQYEWGTFENPDLHVRHVPVTHIHTIPAFGLLFENKKSALYYSGDANDLPNEMLERVLTEEHFYVYQDTCGLEYEGNVHMSLSKLRKKIPEDRRPQVFCMHHDTHLDLGQVKRMGFQLP